MTEEEIAVEADADIAAAELSELAADASRGASPKVATKIRTLLSHEAIRNPGNAVRRYDQADRRNHVTNAAIELAAKIRIGVASGHVPESTIAEVLAFLSAEFPVPTSTAGGAAALTDT